jgi:CDP-4-dehydro-6-deoxyglucose reductase, E1
MLRDHGMTRSVYRAADFDHEYDFQMMGYNVRPLELHAAIARVQLQKLPKFIAARRANYAEFKRLAADLPITFQKSNGFESPFGIPFLCRDPQVRTNVAKALRAANIDCRPPTGGSFLRHRYGEPWFSQKTPMADHIHSCGLFIGNAPWVMGDKIGFAVSVLKEAL